MRSIQIGLIAAMVGATAAAPAWALGAIYPDQESAIESCRSLVVWLNLDRQKYYEPSQPGYGVGDNGGYACLNQVVGEYAQAHPTVVSRTETTRTIAPTLGGTATTTSTTTTERTP